MSDFGELKSDTNFTNVVKNFEESLSKIDNKISEIIEIRDFDALSAEEKIKLDNYVAYAINSLYWSYIKLRGKDPNAHDIKNELARVRQTILRDKEIYECKTMRPVLDRAAAGRFIKHGLHIRFDKEENANLSDGENNNA